MPSVLSPDGTSIAFWQSGSGPPLVLVHGMLASHATTWRFVLPLLEPHFTVYVMDRRGRGDSPDTAPYSLEREAEDIRAVIDLIGQPVDVLGHSFGGLCALEAALLTPAVRRLILYEGVPLRGSDSFSPGMIQHLEHLLAADQLEAALITMLRDVAGMGPKEIDVLRAQPDAWAIRLANARVMPRELRAEHQYVFAPERFRHLQVPALLLVGENSAPRELSNATAIAQALPRAGIRRLEGQEHLAMYTAPDMFVRELLQFLA